MESINSKNKGPLMDKKPSRNRRKPNNKKRKNPVSECPDGIMNEKTHVAKSKRSRHFEKTKGNADYCMKVNNEDDEVGTKKLYDESATNEAFKGAVIEEINTENYKSQELDRNENETITKGEKEVGHFGHEKELEIKFKKQNIPKETLSEEEKPLLSISKSTSTNEKIVTNDSLFDNNLDLVNNVTINTENMSEVKKFEEVKSSCDENIEDISETKKPGKVSEIKNAKNTFNEIVNEKNNKGMEELISELETCNKTVTPFTENELKFSTHELKVIKVKSQLKNTQEKKVNVVNTDNETTSISQNNEIHTGAQDSNNLSALSESFDFTLTDENCKMLQDSEDKSSNVIDPNSSILKEEKSLEVSRSADIKSNFSDCSIGDILSELFEAPKENTAKTETSIKRFQPPFALKQKNCLKARKKLFTIPHMSALDYDKAHSEVNNTLKDEEYKRMCEASTSSQIKNDIVTKIFKQHTIEAEEKENSMGNMEDWKIINDLEAAKHKDSSNIKLIISMPYENTSYEFSKENCIHLKNTNKDKESLSIVPALNNNELSVNERGRITPSLNLNSTSKLGNIFHDNDPIPDKLVFGENNNNEDDIIPTGVFKHLNEIFEYNKNTKTVNAKRTDSSELPKVQCDSIISDKKYCTRKPSSNSNAPKLKIGDTFDLVTVNDCINFKNSKSKKDPKSDSHDKHKTNVCDTRQSIDLNINLGKDKTEENDESTNEINKEIEIKTKEPEIYNTHASNKENNSAKENTQSMLVKERKENSTNLIDTEDYMDMDDDFNLTASQLSMLDADTMSQSFVTKEVGQQTERCNDFGNNALIIETMNLLHNIRDTLNDINKRTERIENRFK